MEVFWYELLSHWIVEIDELLIWDVISFKVYGQVLSQGYEMKHGHICHVIEMGYELIYVS